MPAPDDRRVWCSRWNENLQRKAKYPVETYLSATLSTIIPTCLDVGWNSEPRSGNSVTNHESQFLWTTNFRESNEMGSFWLTTADMRERNMTWKRTLCVPRGLRTEFWGEYFGTLSVAGWTVQHGILR